MELYAERGFEPTSVADIAQRAGLTERTFFRYFADKREVLFSGSEELVEMFGAVVAGAPEALTPMDAVAEALIASAVFFEGRVEQCRQRQAVIDANPSLRERELIKLATLAATVAGALRGRGVHAATANLTAETGIAVFKVAFAAWVDESNDRDLATVMRDSLDRLKTELGAAEFSAPS